MGIFFRAKREQLLDTAEPQKKRNLCRWVRSGLIAWKNGRYEPISRFSSFFNQAAGRRCSFAFPSISPPRRIVIYGTLIPPRKEQSSSLDAISPFTCTIRFRFVVLLFCCFVSTLYAIATNGSKSKMVLKSVLLELLKRRVWIYEIVCRFYSCISRLLLAES